MLLHGGAVATLAFEGTCCSAIHRQATRGFWLCIVLSSDSVNKGNLEMELIDIEQLLSLQMLERKP